MNLRDVTAQGPRSPGDVDLARWRILSGGATDRGTVRTRNEDAFGLFDDLQLFVVADGLGGHAGGEIASQLAVDEIRNSVGRTGSEDLTPVFDRHAGSSVALRQLMIAFHDANAQIQNASRKHGELAGMGAAVASVLLGGPGHHAAIGHVGDVRVQRVRQGEMECLTVDHTLVKLLIARGELTLEEAGRHPQRHVLTKALGISPVVEPTVTLIDLAPGDLFLLTSDGVHETLQAQEILLLANDLRQRPTGLCEELVRLAGERGSRDNATALCLIVAEAL